MVATHNLFSRHLFDQLYSQIDYAKGICPWDVVEQAIAQGCFVWSDPRFVKGYYDLLAGCFRNISGWLKGQYYAQLVLSHMPEGIDDDLIEISQALIEGRFPDNKAWNFSQPYFSYWPAGTLQYCRPSWNGQMFLWSLAYGEYRRKEERRKFKESGYRSPRRNIYRQ